MATKRPAHENQAIRVRKKARDVQALKDQIARAREVITKAEPLLEIEEARLRNLKSSPDYRPTPEEIEADAAQEVEVDAAPEQENPVAQQEAWA